MSRVADRLVALTLAAIDMATGSGDFGNARRWRDSMERAIRTGHTAAFIAGVNERLGKPADSAFTTARNLSRIERRELNAAIDKQLTYLDRFAASLDNLTPAQIAARAEMYAGAVRQTYNAQRWGAWDIPPELLPGSQTCLTRCRCSISVRDNGDGTGVLTRTLGGERHCDECPPLAGNHPVKRRGYEGKSYDGWDDSEIDGWTDDDAMKHMPGSHDQRSHGRSTARRSAARAAYRASRAGGATIAEARAAARDVSQVYANKQRISNIDKQLAGAATESTRRSLEAEKTRLQADTAIREARTTAARDIVTPEATVRGRQESDKKTNAQKILLAEEARLRPQRFESALIIGPDGKEIIKKDGEKYSVTFTDQEVSALRANGNAILTHNHPRGWDVPPNDPRRAGNSFSMEDIQFAVNANLAEIRAVTPTRTFILRRPPQGWRKDLVDIRNRFDAQVKEEFWDLIRSNKLTPSVAEAKHAHEVMLRLANAQKLDYQVIEG